MADVDSIRWIRLGDDEVARLHDAVAETLSRCDDVIAAYHYGSSARRQPARDIDIGIVVARPALTAIDVEPLAEQIAARCGRRRDDFDVRVVNEADPVFLGNLMREGKRCFERNRDQRVAFEVQAMNAWLDFQPVWDRMRRRALEVWSRG